MLELNPDDIQKGIEQLQDFKVKVDKVIRPFLSKNINQKRSIELCQVGKFLVLLDEKAKIIKHGDSPDFTISVEGCEIGLEHQRILKSDSVESFQSISKLFDDAAELFKIEHPNYKLLANCWLTVNDFKFSKLDSQKLKKEISDYIYNFITGEVEYSKPEYIEEVLVMDHSDVAFEYNPGGYITSSIDTENLQKAIIKKEYLFEKYKEKSMLERQWLLLVIGGVSPDSFRFNIKNIDGIRSSKFERIYLLEDFDGRVWRLA